MQALGTKKGRLFGSSERTLFRLDMLGPRVPCRVAPENGEPSEHTAGAGKRVRLPGNSVSRATVEPRVAQYTPRKAVRTLIVESQIPSNSLAHSFPRRHLERHSAQSVAHGNGTRAD